MAANLSVVVPREYWKCPGSEWFHRFQAEKENLEHFLECCALGGRAGPDTETSRDGALSLDWRLTLLKDTHCTAPMMKALGERWKARCELNEAGLKKWLAGCNLVGGVEPPTPLLAWLRGGALRATHTTAGDQTAAEDDGAGEGTAQAQQSGVEATVCA